MFASPGSPNRRSPAPIALTVLAILALAVAGAALARDHVPTPPGGGEGVNLLPADQANPTSLPAPGPQPLLPVDRGRPARQVKADARYGDAGGDDVEVATYEFPYEDDLAVAANGDLFSIIEFADEDQGDYEFEIHRSTDGGTTWSPWGALNSPTPGYRFWDPEIHVAEGAEDRVFVIYTLDPDVGSPREVHVAWSPLDLEHGDFSNDTTLYTTSHSHIFSPSFTTDAATWDEYYCYLAFSADDGNGHDIHFMRSIDQGTTWEPSYVLGSISVSDRGYYHPQVAVGYGGWVHVAWFLGFAPDHEYDNTIRYRRVPNYAGGGLANWENIQSITPHTDDIDMLTTRLAASLVSPDLVMAFNRRVRYANGTWAYDGIMTLDSSDSGQNWSGMNDFGYGFEWLGDVIHQESTDRWLMGVVDPSWGYRWASVSSPTNWSEPVVLADVWRVSGEPSLIIDPSRGGRIGIQGGGRNDDDTYSYFFDAEWRADPGYPNLEDGFPVALAAEPISDPAVVDLDRDGDLEIVFTDAADYIQVYQADGTPLPGWPVLVSTALSDTPVAIGDLNGDGEMSVVIGTMNGLIAAYHADGTLMDGWPADIDVNAPVYVAIGAVGGPYPRGVIAGAGSNLRCYDWHGQQYPGSHLRGMPGRVITSPPAIGDLDGDGRSEVVVAASQSVYAFPMLDWGWNIDLDLEADVTGGITLADFDLDGDVEAVVPLANGVLHLIDEGGVEFPGNWPVTVAGSELNGAALANCLGGSEPEIAVTARNWLVSVVWYDGDVGAGWPSDTDGWYVYGKPIIARVEGSSSDVIVGARGSKGWAYDNFGTVLPGWPKALDNHVYRTPAYGDLDLDGSAEIVLLTLDQLVVVDIANPPTASYNTWPMAGHDPQRTGCFECAEDVVAVEDLAAAGVTRVSMAAPWPNPIAGHATFAYAVPVRARVELSVYDVAGRRVAVVHRAEEAAGRYSISWSGRDGDGRPVASGQYVAMLKVKGPGVDETVARKVTVLR